jgi:exodeoxyribonuclease VII large subunit
VSLQRPLTVAELTGIIRGVISASPDLEDVLVEGEISNLSLPSSGHLYFTLKDGGAAVGCVVWRSQRLQIPFRPENGMTVIVHGRIEVYDAQGRYQLYADRLEPSGIGALALAVDQRRRALDAEGLFDEAAKRPLPLLPRRVAVVTSRTGAALRDVVTVIGRRAPCVDIVLSPATVQGEGAVETLILALERAQAARGVEVVLLVRGGGSLEDLMAFNDERLARAIRASRLPVVCGVGHETDTTIADLAADRRAASPSAAAELVVPDCRRLGAELASRRSRLAGAVRREVLAKRQGLERLARRIDSASPIRRLPGRRQELDARGMRLHGAVAGALGVKRRDLEHASARLRLASPGRRVQLEGERLATRRRRLADLAGGAVGGRRQAVAVRGAQLEALSPLAVLDRGYSITMDGVTGTVLTEAASVRPEQLLRTRLARGTVVSTARPGDGTGDGRGSTLERERMYDSGESTAERA